VIHTLIRHVAPGRIPIGSHRGHRAAGGVVTAMACVGATECEWHGRRG
jgi:hypothetical protein